MTSIQSHLTRLKFVLVSQNPFESCAQADLAVPFFFCPHTFHVLANAGKSTLGVLDSSADVSFLVWITLEMISDCQQGQEAETFIQIIAHSLNKTNEDQTLFRDISNSIAELDEFEGCVDC